MPVEQRRSHTVLDEPLLRVEISRLPGSTRQRVAIVGLGETIVANPLGTEPWHIVRIRRLRDHRDEAAKLDVSDEFWTKEKADKITPEFMAEFNKRMPAASKLPWEMQDAEFTNTTWAKERQWKGPPPGLNREYWFDLNVQLQDMSKTLGGMPTKAQIEDFLWLKFHVLRPKFWRSNARQTDAYQIASQEQVDAKVALNRPVGEVAPKSREYSTSPSYASITMQLHNRGLCFLVTPNPRVTNARNLFRNFLMKCNTRSGVSSV
jgi:hypothetical protein